MVEINDKKRVKPPETTERTRRPGGGVCGLDRAQTAPLGCSQWEHRTRVPWLATELGIRAALLRVHIMQQQSSPMHVFSPWGRITGTPSAIVTFHYFFFFCIKVFASCSLLFSLLLTNIRSPEALLKFASFPRAAAPVGVSLAPPTPFICDRQVTICCSESRCCRHKLSEAW